MDFLPSVIAWLLATISFAKNYVTHSRVWECVITPVFFHSTRKPRTVFAFQSLSRCDLRLGLPFCTCEVLSA